MKLRIALPTAVAVIGLSACSNPIASVLGVGATGAAALAPGELGTTALANLEAAGSFHAEIVTTDTDGTPLEVSADIDKDGDWSASLSNGMDVVITDDGATYVKAGKDVWVDQGLPAESAKKLAGAWISTPEDTLGAGYTRDDILASYEGVDGVESQGEQTLDGQQVIALRGANFTFYVSTAEPYLPVKSVIDGEDGETVVFSAVTDDDLVEAPADAMTVEELLA